MPPAVKSLTSGRLLARSALWNFAGMAAPMLVALFAIPMLIDGMGKERFGLLAIIWMGVGYFSLFDLGLGRALTKMVSERLGREETSDLAPLIWTAFALLAVLGVVGALLLLVLSQPLVIAVLSVPDKLYGEGVAAFRILAMGIPIVVVTAGLIGLLEAHQNFAVIAAIRAPLGVVTFGAPLISLQFTPSLALATAVLLAGRIFALAAFYTAAARASRELRQPQLPDRSQVRPLLGFGGWLTVTNVVGPLMTYLDRFFIGALLSMSAVTYYVTPYEILSRLQLLPRAVMGVLYPAMAVAHGGDRKRLKQLYGNSSQLIYWMMLPVTAGVFLLAPEALFFWLGDDFRTAGTPVVHFLAAGWAINALARPAFTVLQSTGRPDLVAKTHIVEVVPYLALLWWLTTDYGIAGAASAWMLRVVSDTVILNAISYRVIPELRQLVVRAYISALATSVAFGSFWFLDSLVGRVVVLIVVGVIAGLRLWPIVRQGATRKAAA